MTTIKTARRALLALLLAAASSAGTAQSQNAATAAPAAGGWPGRPVTLVVPTAAAGGTDTIARVLGEGLSKMLGQPFVVDNRPGANGTIGANAVAQAAPDGYRLLFTYAAAMAVSPGMYRKLPYHPTDSFIPVAQVSRGGNLLLVNNKLPVHSVQEFVEYVKARPGELSYCSWGLGSGGHLTMEHLLKQTGGKMLHVPYKGSRIRCKYWIFTINRGRIGGLGFFQAAFAGASWGGAAAACSLWRAICT